MCFRRSQRSSARRDATRSLGFFRVIFFSRSRGISRGNVRLGNETSETRIQRESIRKRSLNPEPLNDRSFFEKYADRRSIRQNTRRSWYVENIAKTLYDRSIEKITRSRGWNLVYAFLPQKRRFEEYFSFSTSFLRDRDACVHSGQYW